jgi:hypothetical protein
MWPLLILAGASIALDVFGKKKQGDAAKKAGEAAAQREDWNASVADLSATDALARGRAEESSFRTSIRGLIGTQRAGYAAQGIEVGSGSAAAMQGDTAYRGELDAQRIRSNAAREAWGFSVEAYDRRLAAGYSRLTGQQAKEASRWAMAGTVARGAYEVARGF